MVHFPPETRAPTIGSESYAPPVDPSLTLTQLVSAGLLDFRQLLEETAFQALTEEPLFRRPHTSVMPCQGEGNLLSLPFPKRLWNIVNSNQFASVWWDDGGPYIGINEKLFQKEILERDGWNKLFETDCMKSFIRQLHLHGFSKMHHDIHSSTCLTNFFHPRETCLCPEPGNSGQTSQWAELVGSGVAESGWVEIPELPLGNWVPISTPGGGDGDYELIRGKGSDWCPVCLECFIRDCPHFLMRMKRRVGIKAALRQVESKPEALGFPQHPQPPSHETTSQSLMRTTRRHRATENLTTLPP
ncbi:LOW QUALITY PROTEIN: heat shock transcription factor, X-linked-like [Diceros bicornis minor]|uniref:LOW QUALITY PROTEIN: heat shock transcription factor, X-linked-like n=1 Tax=Diceros bicornis minor TaxID=77932 RepID=UPI0026F04262|nr:LOW QUALITY PROTEIN: heat shock transcription factor, X-linked-like [Diceros bicornis minor]